MLEYVSRYYDKLLQALYEHLEMVLITLVLSVFLASVLTVISIYCKIAGTVLIHMFSFVYSIPSLALFAILIPLTGLGRETAIIVLVAYNQYLLLRNFIGGLNHVDAAVMESAIGLGMNKWQILTKVQIPLARKSLFTGIHLAVVSTIGIATIAASINAGGIGSILFDGLRTVNVYKIVWGSILAAGLALLVNGILNRVERHF